MFIKIENTIVHCAEMQSIEPSGQSIKITFINGKDVQISTHKYDYIINGSGRTTNAMYEKYDESIKQWQKTTIEEIFNILTSRGF